MKKLFIMVCIAALIALTGCGSTKNEGKSSKRKEGKTVHVNFGEPITFKDDNPLANGTIEVRVTISDYKLVKNASKHDWENEEYDFVTLHALIENIGSTESFDYLLNENSFDLYDADGKQLKTKTPRLDHIDGIFGRAKFRPGGKNEGVIYISVEEGSIPAEIIYYESSIVKSGFGNVNRYIFDIQ